MKGLARELIRGGVWRYRAARHACRLWRLRSAVHSSNPRRIIIGAGGVSDEGWIAMEEADLDILNSNDWASLFDQDSIDAILAEHVWEHLDVVDAVTALKMCHRYLRHGGYLRIAVPDGLHPSKDYIDAVKPGGSGSGADDHKTLYDYRSLGDLLKKEGYDMRLLEYFDEKGNFRRQAWRSTDGYVRRSSAYDERNAVSSLRYTSLIADAVKRVCDH